MNFQETMVWRKMERMHTLRAVVTKAVALKASDASIEEFKLWLMEAAHDAVVEADVATTAHAQMGACAPQ